jgi:hypothetical protein
MWVGSLIHHVLVNDKVSGTLPGLLFYILNESWPVVILSALAGSHFLRSISLLDYIINRKRMRIYLLPAFSLPIYVISCNNSFKSIEETSQYKAVQQYFNQLGGVFYTDIKIFSLIFYSINSIRNGDAILHNTTNKYFRCPIQIIEKY